MNISLLYNVFTGETSPLIEARVDSQAQQMGASKMENFIPMPTGGLRKRPGTVYDLATTSTITGRKLYNIDYTTEEGEKLLLVISAADYGTNSHLFLFKKQAGKYIQKGNPLIFNGLQRDITYCIEKDVIWVFCKHNEELLCHKFTWNGISIQRDSNSVFAGTYLIPRTACFYAGRLCLAGGQLRVNVTKEYVDEQEINVTLEETIQEMHLTIGNGISPFIITYPNAEETNKVIKISEYEITSTLYDGELAYVTGVGSYGHIGVLYLTEQSPTHTFKGEGGIPEFNIGLGAHEFYHGHGGTNGRVEIRIKLKIYYEITWTTASGKKEKNRITLSKATDSMTGENRYTDFELGSNPADAIAIEEQDMYGSRIQWVFPHRRLLVATEKALWSDTGEVPTPSTFDLNIITYKGANEIKPVALNEQVLYVSRDGNKIYSVTWVNTDQYGGYQIVDISETASHLFYSGIKSLAVSNYPYTILWVVTNDGRLVSGIYNGGAYFFSNHTIENPIDSITVMSEAEGDILCIFTRRTNNTGERLHLEHLLLEDLIHDDWEDSHYVDSGEIYEFDPPQQTITVPHSTFNMKTVNVFADGAKHPPVIGSPYTDQTCRINLQYPVSKVHIGLPIKSVYCPNTRQVPANGTSLGKKRRVDKVTLKLYKTLGGKAGVTEDKADPLLLHRYKNYALGEAPEPFTGEVEVTVSGNIDTAGQITIVHEDPTPFTLLALTQEVAILEV